MEHGGDKQILAEGDLESAHVESVVNPLLSAKHTAYSKDVSSSVDWGTVTTLVPECACMAPEWEESAGADAMGPSPHGPLPPPERLESTKDSHMSVALPE